MKLFKWIKKRLSHKLEHLTLKYFKEILKKHGMTIFIIIILWEIIESVLLPMLFVFLGNNVNPIFFGCIPACWIICLHWFAVPLLFGLWLKITGKERTL